HHVHMPSGRPCPCRTSASPRRRTPRCRAKPTVKGVVDDDEDASRESDPERKEEEEAMTATGTLPGWLRLDTVGMDILSIAAPAVLALAADPIAALVDTAFVGHIGNMGSFLPSCTHAGCLRTMVQGRSVIHVKMVFEFEQLNQQYSQPNYATLVLFCSIATQKPKILC
uniref:Uncharacterized protein n=1 Tax=Aegilops tauschii subsp. strangulata TaxID=200361 RepID=A0A453KE63_AEGTS